MTAAVPVRNHTTASPADSRNGGALSPADFPTISPPDWVRAPLLPYIPHTPCALARPFSGAAQRNPWRVAGTSDCAGACTVSEDML